MSALPLAGWMARFWAWLIDVLLIGILWGIIRGAIGTPLDIGYIHYGAYGLHLNFEAQGLLLFIYWTALEGYRGQSIGKMAMNLATVGTEGEKIGFEDAAIESFGKAFLLPIDCIIGWLAMRGSGQRLFNRISNTVVIRADIECERCNR
ncbi:MAG: RDD family protein [Methanotrichaceae archaeon]